MTDGELVMEWTEMGGVGLTPPSRTGFGTRLITQTVEYDLDGRVFRDYRPGGVHYVLTLPASKIVAGGFSNNR
jgi:two-component sensor histidine kinase